MATKTTKNTATKTTAHQETKKEFTLKRHFVMWIYKSKNGNKYLSGKTEDGEKLKGFFNSKKKNPKEPDIRVYATNKDGDIINETVISLWCNTTENGKKYVTGKIDKQRIVGFFNSKAEVNGVVPYLNVYFSDDSETENAPKYSKKEKPEFEDVEVDNDLPF